MRLAYADSPYFKCCSLYGHYHPDGRCWDDLDTHRLLVARLVTDYPDGWAMSLSMPSLQAILPLCPADVRVAAWVKSFCAFKKGVRPCYAWEPIIWRGGRNPSCGYPHKPPEKGGKQTTPKDFLITEGDAIKEPITLRKGLTGAKPEKVEDELANLLNVQPGDSVDDLYPGTGIMGRVAAARTAVAA